MLPVDTFVIHNAMPAGTVQCKQEHWGGGEPKILCKAIREMETTAVLPCVDKVFEQLIGAQVSTSFEDRM